MIMEITDNLLCQGLSVKVLVLQLRSCVASILHSPTALNIVSLTNEGTLRVS